MKKLQTIIKNTSSFFKRKLRCKYLFPILFSFLLFTGNIFAQSRKAEWITGETPEFYSPLRIGKNSITIEYENFPVIFNQKNKITITSTDKSATFKILLPHEKPIVFKGSHTFFYKPTAFFTDKLYIISGKDTTYSFFSVKGRPNPEIYFDSTNFNVLIRSDLKKAKLHARIKGKTCKILDYKTVITNKEAYSSYGNTITNQDSTLTEQTKSRVAYLENGDNFFLKDIILELPDGTYQTIDLKKIKLVKDKFHASYCKFYDSGLESPFDLSKSYCDLRIKIETDSLKKNKTIIQKFFDELNAELNGVKVKFVEIFPNITFSNKKYQYEYKTEPNLFYPYTRINNDITYQLKWNQIDKSYDKIDINADQFIEIIMRKLGVEFNKSTVTKDSSGYYHLTPLCKEHLNSLYSNGSINRIYKELKVENPNDKNQDFTLIITLISLIIFLIIEELTNSINFTRKLFISKPAFWKTLITYPLLAQIPLVVFLIIRHINESKITLDYILTAERYYMVYAVLVGIILWSLDKFQYKIHSFALRLFIDFMATIFIFWAAYQLIFMATHLDYVRLDMLRWQWIYIPLTVAFYRLFNLFMQRKMDQMMQEKELEISKQKEMTTKAELLALQSRINPHFLYNSLNSIASLSATDAKRTEQMAVNLSKLFRYNLNKGDDLMTTIEEELEMVKLYLDIEKQRFGDRLDYRVEISEELMKFQIPIFLLQPLVENAIKHGISKITESGVIKISIEKSDDRLSIKVFDNGPAFNNEPIHGYGLQNIFDKLTLVYRSNYSMQFVNEPEKYIEIAIGRKK